MEEYYDVLNLSKFNSLEEIKNKYINLAIQWHPKNKNDIQMFKKVSDAFQILYLKSAKLADPMTIFNLIFGDDFSSKFFNYNYFSDDLFHCKKNYDEKFITCRKSSETYINKIKVFKEFIYRHGIITQLISLDDIVVYKKINNKRIF